MFSQWCRQVSVRVFFSAVLHSDRTEEDLRRRVSEQCDSSYLPVDWPQIEYQIKEGQPLGLTCASLQDVYYHFSDNPLPILSVCISGEEQRRPGTPEWLQDPQRQIFKGSPTSWIDSRRRITHCGDLDGQKWSVETQAFTFSMKN